MTDFDRLEFFDWNVAAWSGSRPTESLFFVAQESQFHVNGIEMAFLWDDGWIDGDRDPRVAIEEEIFERLF